VIPRAACSATARTVASGECPAIAPVSPKAEVDVLEPVGVTEARAGRLDREDREAAGPAHHPVHRHAAEQVRPRAARQVAGTRVVAFEPGELVVEQALQRVRHAR